ncbi:small heat shock protein p36-like [Mercenaria mercenaria]|uniref:small heat shock protein p36-like n=1 Tax=Mercenaria mercenaria TaxID=6596 RepID=UPI001E1D7703|nr:small heat shock protein p36-like [Mercenaria mercenaria]XP_045175089.1 small heat shock protein p36-like [Mercenaria mercenaria]
MARFRSELSVPIKRDEMDFQDRQMKVWEDMETKMEKRKREWSDDFDRMRDEFFTLKPGLADRRASTIGLDKIGALRTVYETEADGQQRFKVRFDVSEFKPEEIQVKVQDNKVIVYAKHEERNNAQTVSREYSRQVDIPPNVDQEKLQCVLSRDGILTVDGPVFSNQLVAQHQVLPIQQAVQPDRTLQLATPVKNPIITEPDGTRKLRLTVDAGEFRPEEVVVKTMEKKLVVHAEHVEKTAGKTLHKEFNKEYELPDSVDQSAITAYIGDEGKLIIEAPIKNQVRKYSVTQSQDVRKVVVTKESTVTINDSQNRPVVTINVHPR